ncbi:MAG: 4-hydroxy-tetrahydrodipicolinate reductase [Solirubrobacterales bacterium]
MAEAIRVLVTGALGKMGAETVRAVTASPETELVGAVDVQAKGHKISSITGNESDQRALFTDLEQAIERCRPQVTIDFTNPQAVYENVRTCLRKGIHCVVGSTGLTAQDIAALAAIAEENRIGLAIVPNFAIGAVLMMKFAETAAKYFEDVEIIELHHNQKLDAPSGTAIKTAEMIGSVKPFIPTGHPEEFEKLPGVRGGAENGVRIHSVRLPGMIAHQEVIFGGLGQVLTIRHDSMNRESFMPGVILSVKKVIQTTGLTYGLEPMMEF